MNSVFDSMAGAIRPADVRASPDQLRDHRDYVGSKEQLTFADILRRLDGLLESVGVLENDAFAVAHMTAGHQREPQPTTSSGSAEPKAFTGIPAELANRIVAIERGLEQTHRSVMVAKSVTS